jgi:hypothetical protein
VRSDGWGYDPPLPKAKPKATKTPAKEYSRPGISKVAVALKIDDPSFAPGTSDRYGMSMVFARIPSGQVRISEGGSVVIECGFGLELPPGYRVRVSSLFANLFVEVNNLDMFRLHVTNLSDETILKDREQIGLIWIEPVCFFDWIHKD